MQLATSIYFLAALISMQGLCMGLYVACFSMFVIVFFGFKCIWGPLYLDPFTPVLLPNNALVCAGLLDTGGNVLILRYWGQDCGVCAHFHHVLIIKCVLIIPFFLMSCSSQPWMQGLHFAFGLGAFTVCLTIITAFTGFDSS